MLELESRSMEALVPSQLLPHRPPMRLIETVLERDPGHVVCRGRISPEVPGVFGDRAPVILGVELGAQSACFLNPSRPQGDPHTDPRMGYLVSIRNANFAVDSLPVDTCLRVEVVHHGQVAALTMVRIAVYLPTRPQAAVEATLSTLLSDPVV